MPAPVSPTFVRDEAEANSFPSPDSTLVVVATVCLALNATTTKLATPQSEAP
jgi:hypothetical protein